MYLIANCQFGPSDGIVYCSELGDGWLFLTDWWLFYVQWE